MTCHMPDPQLDLFLFDLAGTTVSDDGYVLEAFQRTTREAELAVDPAVLKARMGWHKQLVFATCLREAGRDEQPAPQLAARFESHYADVVRERGLVPTPGAQAAVAALQDRGVAVGFTTGFSRGTADLVLAQVGWSGYLSVASTEVENGRPAPDLIQLGMRRAGRTDPHRVGTAGDTPSDLQAGTAAGCRLVIGVGCGTHALDELRGEAHTHLLDDLSTLPEILDAL